MNDDIDGSPGRQGLWRLAKTRVGAEIDRRNFHRFISWLIIWAIAFTVVTGILQANPGLATGASMALAIVPTAIGAAALLAYVKFLRVADGPLRQIQIEGLAFGFGTVVLFVLGYRTFEHAGAPAIQTNHIIAVMMIGWIVGHLLSMKRYS